jgi:hypothetical protein
MKSWYPPEVKLQFFLVDRANNPEQGCFESHQNVYKDAKSKGYKRVLIFEDDAFPRFPWNDIVQKTNDALKQLETTNWDILALGYYPFRTYKTNMKNVLKIGTSYGSHAYIANVPNMKSDKWRKITNDRFLFSKRKSSYISYATYDILFEQKFEKSQINKLSAYEFGLKELPKIFGGIEGMRDLSINCHNLVLLVFGILVLPIMIIITITTWSTTGRKGGIWCLGITILLIIIALLLLFLL